MALAVMKEAQPAVTMVTSKGEVDRRMKEGNLVALGFFASEDRDESLPDAERSTGGPYQAFQSAADTLKGYADFLVADSEDLDGPFSVQTRPTVLYVGKGSAIGE